MALLDFNQLREVLPIEDIPTAQLKYERDVDTRSVTFESGITITFSDYMSGKFEEFLSVSKEDWKGPTWFRDAWEHTLSIINSQNLAEAQALMVTSFILGKIDFLVTYGTD